MLIIKERPDGLRLATSVTSMDDRDPAARNLQLDGLRGRGSRSTSALVRITDPVGQRAKPEKRQQDAPQQIEVISTFLLGTARRNLIATDAFLEGHNGYEGFAEQ